ncbi:hypothetical protein D9M70_380640 [compost metagenome]
MRKAAVRPGSSVVRVKLWGWRVTTPTLGVWAGGGAEASWQPVRASVVSAMAETKAAKAGFMGI